MQECESAGERVCLNRYPSDWPERCLMLWAVTDTNVRLALFV